MDNNHINNHLGNHICNNNRRMERNYYGRTENVIMPRREDSFDCEGNELHNHLEYYENHQNHCDYHEHSYCNVCDKKCKNEHGGEVYSLNVVKNAKKNNNFRESIWTGRYLQMTLMSIACSHDIGVEMHEDTDQYIRVEHGYAMALTGCERNCLNNRVKLCAGDAIFIPAGTWHNIVNIGRCDLKLSSVYAPPHHPKCTVHKYRPDNY